MRRGCSDVWKLRYTTERQPGSDARTSPAGRRCARRDALEVGAYAAVWAPLPPASLGLPKQAGDVGGRVWVTAHWDFATDPGGAWSTRQTMFFLVGVEDGVYRIFEVGTAAYMTLP